MSTKRCTDFVPPDRPVESRCPGCRRLRGFLTRWPPSVTVVAVTGAVTAVTWGRDPALDVTGTVPAVIAVAGCHSPSRRADHSGHVLLATLGSLAHATLACATEVATALRDTRRYARGSPESIPAASLSVESLVTYRSRRWSRASRDPEVASSFQNVPRPKRPRCRARVATPPPAPGSCPGGSQAIG